MSTQLCALCNKLQWMGCCSAQNRLWRIFLQTVLHVSPVAYSSAKENRSSLSHNQITQNITLWCYCCRKSCLRYTLGIPWGNLFIHPSKSSEHSSERGSWSESAAGGYIRCACFEVYEGTWSTQRKVIQAQGETCKLHTERTRDLLAVRERALTAQPPFNLRTMRSPTSYGWSMLFGTCFCVSARARLCVDGAKIWVVISYIDAHAVSKGCLVSPLANQTVRLCHV